MLESGDRLAIHELIARVGHIIDDQEWGCLPEVFTEAFISDATAVGYSRCEGLSEVAKAWSNPRRRADGHHGTNVVLTEVDEATVKATSKGFSLYGTSEGHTLIHDDVIVRTPEGWRISKRVTRYSRPRSSDALARG
jgi:hypothetical protein